MIRYIRGLGLSTLSSKILELGVSLLAGVLFGALVAFSSNRAIFIVLGGLVIFLLLLSGPEYVILLLLAAGSTILDPKSLPSLFGLESASLILLLLLGLMAVYILSGFTKWVHTPLDIPLLIFFGASLASYLNARYNLRTVTDFRNDVSPVLLQYLVFFVVTNLVRTRRQLLILVNGMLVLATIVATVMIAQQIIGPGVSIIPGKQYIASATILGNQEITGVARITFFGEFLAYAMLLPSWILYSTSDYLKSHKWLLLIPMGLLLIATVITFTRSLWLGILVGIVGFIIVARSQRKNFVLLLLVVGVIASLFISIGRVYIPRIGTIADGFIARFETLGDTSKLLNDSSTTWRLLENEYAIAKFKEYPVLGIGPGAIYRPPSPLRYPADTLTAYIHNAYLYLLVDLGLIGFVPFLWLSIVYIVRGIRFGRTLRDPILRGLVISFAVSYLAIMLVNITSPWYLLISGASVIGIMFGVGEVAIRLGKQPEASNAAL